MEDPHTARTLFHDAADRCLELLEEIARDAHEECVRDLLSPPAPLPPVVAASIREICSLVRSPLTSTVWVIFPGPRLHADVVKFGDRCGDSYHRIALVLITSKAEKLQAAATCYDASDIVPREQGKEFHDLRWHLRMENERAKDLLEGVESGIPFTFSTFEELDEVPGTPALEFTDGAFVLWGSTFNLKGRPLDYLKRIWNGRNHRLAARNLRDDNEDYPASKSTVGAQLCLARRRLREAVQHFLPDYEDDPLPCVDQGPNLAYAIRLPASPSEDSTENQLLVNR